jgi:positive regulator of sigma E activity
MDEMMKEDIGTVVAINGRKVTLEICPTEGCASCSMSGVCGAGNKNRYFTLETDQPVEIGDQVTLQIHGGSEVVSSLVLFLLPILFMIFGFVLGRFILGLKEGSAVLISILGLGLSFFVVRLIDHFYGKKMFMTIIPKDGMTKEGDSDENSTA